MEQEIVVSIVCDTYNHGRYIRNALNGFVSQKTNFKYEVLIHDDASTDNTAEIIREYEEKYPELIKPIYQTENQYSQNINIDVVHQYPRVKGKYIAFCEGDDYWTDPMKLQKQYDFMEANPEYSLCTCATIWQDMRTGAKKEMKGSGEDRDVTLEEIILLNKGRVFQYASYFIKAELLISRPDWVTCFGTGDYSTAIYAAVCGKVRMLSDVMTVYRFRADNSWTSKADDVEFYATAMRKTISGLLIFNEATDYCHDALVSRRVKMINYDIARRKRDLKALTGKDLQEIYQSKGVLKRSFDVLYCISPKLYRLIKKLLRRA